MGEPIKEGSLTGHRRYRKLKGVLALEVCYNAWAYGHEGRPGRWLPMWRLATPSDVTGAEIAGEWVDV